MSAQPSTLIHRHRLSVTDYHRMAEVGVLTPDARVELIEGEIVDMAPIGSQHSAAVRRLARLLQRTVGDRAQVLVQDPIRLNIQSEPQPDLALLKPRADDYAAALPTAADTLLIIEVSDSSAAYDLQVKARLYAQHGVPELWVIDLTAGTVRFFRTPRGAEYLEMHSSPKPGRVPISQLADLSIDLDALLEGLLPVAP